ncbi:MAG: radical SAM protein [Candidatus Omnitrophota bacterium]
MEQAFNYIYGPVYSWRLGMSLGIDPVASDRKMCNYNCIYCQLGPSAQMISDRRVFVPTGALLEEISRLSADLQIDHITFSGRGEPTLARNLGDMIDGIRAVRSEPIAVITNGGLMADPQVRRDLAGADRVLAKLDAPSADVWNTIDRPVDRKGFEDMVDGMAHFSREYEGIFALQMMFVEENKDAAEEMADVARRIAPDEIELNTPLRPCGVKPLDRGQMEKIKRAFTGIDGVVMIYDRERKACRPMDEDATVRRHGRYHQSEG